MATPTSPPLVILRRKQVEARLGLSRSFLYSAMAAQTFPRPVQLSRHAVGWLESDINAWLEARIQASQGLLNNQTE